MRQRRRRQEHAHRPAPVGVAAPLRGPARRARGRLAPRRDAGGGARLRAPARRPRGRARAGDHDRRRVPVLLDRQAQVHRRRHARPRAVHAQHGHGRVHGRLRAHPARRAQGRAHADAPAQLPRPPARHPPRRGRREQDGPRRLLPGAVRRDRARISRLRTPARPRGDLGHPAVGAPRRQRRRPVGRDAVVRRPDPHGLPRDGRGRPGAHAGRAVPAPGAVGEPADLRLPRLRRHGRGRLGGPRRPRRRAPARPGDDGRARRHVRRRPRRAPSPARP